MFLLMDLFKGYFFKVLNRFENLLILKYGILLCVLVWINVKELVKVYAYKCLTFITLIKLNNYFKVEKLIIF
jgi:hypothetical protein